MTAVRVWCCLLALLCWGAASAETLRLAANLWPPFTDASALNGGVATDLVRTALARGGYASSYVEVPWERAMRGLQRGEYDALVAAWYGEERAVYGHFSKPYLINRIRLLQRKGGTIQFRQLSDLYPYLIAVGRGYAYSPEFDNDPRLRKFVVGDFTNAARMLSRGRVDLALDDEMVARYHFGRDLSDIRDELEFLPQPLSESSSHLLVRRSHADHQRIVEAFDQAIEAMRADGSYVAIFRRHGLEQAVEKLPALPP